MESYGDSVLAEVGISDTFVQDNPSRSRQNVVRGVHFQSGPAKLVRCARGAILDLLVDIRRGAPRFGAADMSSPVEPGSLFDAQPTSRIAPRTMVTTYAQAGTPVVQMNEEEFLALLEREIRDRVGLSLEEFVARANAGELD